MTTLLQKIQTELTWYNNNENVLYKELDEIETFKDEIDAYNKAYGGCSYEEMKTNINSLVEKRNGFKERLVVHIDGLIAKCEHEVAMKQYIADADNVKKLCEQLEIFTKNNQSGIESAQRYLGETYQPLTNDEALKAINEAVNPKPGLGSDLAPLSKLQKVHPTLSSKLVTTMGKVKAILEHSLARLDDAISHVQQGYNPNTFLWGAVAQLKRHMPTSDQLTTPLTSLVSATDKIAALVTIKTILTAAAVV